MLQANDHLLLTQRPECSLRKPLLAAPRRSRSKSASFPEAVVACLVEGRPPSPVEITTVAARICKECHGSGGPSWRDIPSESRLYKFMIAAARAALGDVRIARPASPILRSDPAVWWRSDRPLAQPSASGHKARD